MFKIAVRDEEKKDNLSEADEKTNAACLYEMSITMLGKMLW